MLLADAVLARRLERTEAHANAAFVESRALLSPELEASWVDVNGAWAMFDGVGSPLTQTFGLGLFSEPTPAQLDQLEAFFAARGSAVAHEVSPLADPLLLPLLTARGYRVVQWSTVLARPLGPMTADPTGGVTVRRIASHEADHWAEVAALGWGAHGDLGDFVRGLGQVSARAQNTHCFIAELDGTAIASGSLHLHEGVALLAGASTHPEYRRRGAQRALLAARLRHAHERGCELAMMGAAPGSDSQRNAQRAGFSIVYSRVKFARP